MLVSLVSQKEEQRGNPAQRTVHLLPRLQEILRVRVTHKPVPLALVGVLVADDLALDVRGVARTGERSFERFVADGGV